VRCYARGTSIPYKEFKGGCSFHDVFYQERLNSGAALITGGLPGWFLPTNATIQAFQNARMLQPGPNEAALHKILVDFKEAAAN
jgi:hypothetical protein